MASALETLWASFWNQDISHVRHILAKVMDCPLIMLFLAIANVYFCHSNSEISGTVPRGVGALLGFGNVVDAIAFLQCALFTNE